MEAVDRSLIALKLLLEEFGVSVGKLGDPPPHADVVASIMSLCQIVHPLGYQFELKKLNGTCRIRSSRLTNEIDMLVKKGRSGTFVSLRRFEMRPDVAQNIEQIKHLVFNQPEGFAGKTGAWLFLLGLYNELKNNHADVESISAIFVEDYPNLLPYLDMAEEALTRFKERY